MSNSTFYEDMCKTFLPADIPFNKLANTAFRKVLQKYTGCEIPHQTTLQKYYVEKIYNTCITEIRGKLTNQHIWCQLMRPTDAIGGHVVTVIVGGLDPEALLDIPTFV
ncbi:hypothetical protein ANN_28244 [Periplaneta americana]|uniref:Uncharacterized protein n=1 Tax=Periplaneta americana TaxID=6978 RepID=A0ABQ8RUU6_PERAM|nr:hypothetical protein ANN_28244 [Periplaneta americana]